MQISEAIVLAGGLGTRLRSVVPDLPKCMALINGKPFIYFLVKHLQQQGIEKFIFSLGYKHHHFLDFFSSIPNLKYELVVEEEPLGTGGAIKFASKKANTPNVLVTNGDTLFTANLQELNLLHFEKQTNCTLALKPMKNFERYGTVKINNDKKIIAFEEKKPCLEGLINGGVTILNINNFLSCCPQEKFSFEKDFLEKNIIQENFYGLVQDEYFIDIGIPEDYNKAQIELK